MTITLTGNQTETIESVAIVYQDEMHVLPRPNRHHNVIREIAKKNGIGIHGGDIQGFMTNKGRFVNRVEGLEIALAANQVLDPTNIRAGRLYSEDLW
jgi:hypothetical protein